LDVVRNVEATVAAVEAAADGGADIVVLPELASTGYVLDSVLLQPVAEDVGAPGPALRAWADVAKRRRIAIVAGFAERSGTALYNSAAVFGPDGKLETLYRKLHLFAGEVSTFSPGDLGLPVVQVGASRVAPLICYDLRFPEVVRILAVLRADLIAVPTAWVGGFDRESADPDIGQVRTVRVLANLNSTPIACASQVGQAGPFQFLGSSVLVDAFGGDVAAPASRTEICTVVLDLDERTTALARDRGEGVAPLRQRRVDVYDELLGYSPGSNEPSRSKETS
jgi:predicted amidohydrolase